MKMAKTAEDARPRLGRGLAALIGESRDAQAALARPLSPQKVPIEFLRTNPRNPRKTFDEAELDDLAASIREKGVIQPILARAVPHVADAFEIIAGERRWRAAQRAGLHEVPIIAVEADDRQALELAIIENVQRSDLNALEEAAGYERLGADFGYTQADLAKVIGKSRSHVANTLRLLNLPESARRLLGEGAISAGHARALLMATSAEALAVRIVNEGLSVRDIERIVQEEGASQKDGPPRERSLKPAKDADTRALERELSQTLGLKVAISHNGESGDVRISYRSLEQLDSLVRVLRDQ
jgi:ParB family chromosome partitioning protein